MQSLTESATLPTPALVNPAPPLDVVFKDRDYTGLKSEPEYGIAPDAPGALELLDSRFAFDRIARELLASADRLSTGGITTTQRRNQYEVTDQARFGKALQYALELHGNQTMKGRETPYIAHLLGVASITMMYGGDEDASIGALLHDALEDAPNPRETRTSIQERFGDTVLEIVEACTDTTQHPKPEWRPRKEAHVKHMENVSDKARLVYAADKLQNIRAILQDLRTDGEAVWGRFNGGKAGTFWYYRAMIDLFRKTGTNRQLVDELARTVNEAEKIAYMVPEQYF